MKVLLRVDGLTGKVTAYKETGHSDSGLDEKEEHESEMKNFDTAVELESIDLFVEAQQANQDVFYENARLVKKPKDPNEFHNASKELSEEIERLKKEEWEAFIAFAKSRRAQAEESELSRLKSEREKKEQKLKSLRDGYLEKLAKKATAKASSSNFKYYCSVCLIIRDENEYLEEWLDWHIGQGVQHFYIYDHGSKEPVAEFIRAFDKYTQDLITVIDFGGNHEFAQHEAYNDCLQRFGKESRWIGYIDSDEMVVVKNGKKLPEFLKDFEDYAGLFVVWVTYGAGGQKQKSGLPCMQRFTAKSPSRHADGVGKVFVQPAYIRRMLTHNGYPIEGFVVVGESKDPVDEAEAWMLNATTDNICLNHYYTKSYEEWVEKMSRGSCDPYFFRKYEEFFLFNPDMEHCREQIFPEQEYEISKKISR